MEYEQQIVEENISIIEGKVKNNLYVASGQRIEKGKNVKVYSTAMESATLVDSLMVFLDKINIREILKFICDKTEGHKKNISVFIKLHREKVYIDSADDEREYGCVRIVYKDMDYGVMYREVPIFYKDDVSVILTRIDKVIEELLGFFEKKLVKVGDSIWEKQIVVFSPQATGYFIHEVVGHLLEEDIYVYGKRYMEQINVPKLTVVDDIAAYGTLLGLNKIDDNGEMIRPVELIRDGQVINVLSEKENKYGVARRTDYTKKVLPRMRCTWVKGVSNNSKESFIRDNRNVLYIDNVFGGGISYVDGYFCIKGSGSYIRNGEVESHINNILVNAYIHEYLDRISEIGNDVEMYSTECNKMGHVVRVGIGGPSICFEGVNVLGDVWKYDSKYM